MTRAEFIISSIKFLYGAEMDEVLIQQDGEPFVGCYGLRCPTSQISGDGEFEDIKQDCDSCPYHDFWEGDSNLTIPTRKEICK